MMNSNKEIYDVDIILKLIHDGRIGDAIKSIRFFDGNINFNDQIILRRSIKANDIYLVNEILIREDFNISIYNLNSLLSTLIHERNAYGKADYEFIEICELILKNSPKDDLNYISTLLVICIEYGTNLDLLDSYYASYVLRKNLSYFFIIKNEKVWEYIFDKIDSFDHIDEDELKMNYYLLYRKCLSERITIPLRYLFSRCDYNFFCGKDIYNTMFVDYDNLFIAMLEHDDLELCKILMEDHFIKNLDLYTTFYNIILLDIDNDRSDLYKYNYIYKDYDKIVQSKCYKILSSYFFSGSF